MGRFFALWAAFLSALAVLVAAFAQSDGNPAENPVTVDESRPASVATPTSDTRMNEAGQPLTPQAPGRRPQTGETPMGETVSPSEEAEASAEALIPPEPARKLWRFTPLCSAGAVYDDNIEFSNTDRIADVILTLSAGLAFELGDFRSGSENYLSAYWLGSPAFYLDNPDQNNFNQSAALIAQYRWSKLVARFDSNFSIARGGNREVNEITTTQSFSNSLRFQYDYSEKTSFDLKFSQDASIVESFENTYRYEVAAGMGYQMFPKTNVGLQFVGGVLESASTPTQDLSTGAFAFGLCCHRKADLQV